MIITSEEFSSKIKQIHFWYFLVETGFDYDRIYTHVYGKTKALFNNCSL